MNNKGSDCIVVVAHGRFYRLRNMVVSEVSLPDSRSFRINDATLIHEPFHQIIVA